jgi:hypothetical protein
MKSILDQNIFNTVNPSAFDPKPKKPLPFPLENFDEELGVAYEQVNRILIKLEAAEKNPINNSPAKIKRLRSLKYKVKTCLKFLKEVSVACSDLWF